MKQSKIENIYTFILLPLYFLGFFFYDLFFPIDYVFFFKNFFIINISFLPLSITLTQATSSLIAGSELRRLISRTSTRVEVYYGLFFGILSIFSSLVGLGSINFNIPPNFWYDVYISILFLFSSTSLLSALTLPMIISVDKMRNLTPDAQLERAFSQLNLNDLKEDPMRIENPQQLIFDILNQENDERLFRLYRQYAPKTFSRLICENEDSEQEIILKAVRKQFIHFSRILFSSNNYLGIYQLLGSYEDIAWIFNEHPDSLGNNANNMISDFEEVDRLSIRTLFQNREYPIFNDDLEALYTFLPSFIIRFVKLNLFKDKFSVDCGLSSLEKILEKDVKRTRLFYNPSDDFVGFNPLSERSERTLQGFIEILNLYYEEYKKNPDLKIDNRISNFPILTIIDDYLPLLTKFLVEHTNSGGIGVYLSSLQNALINQLLLFFSSKYPDGWEVQHVIKNLQIIYLGHTTPNTYNKMLGSGLKRINQIFDMPITNSRYHPQNRLRIIDFYLNSIKEAIPIYSNMAFVLLSVYFDAGKKILSNQFNEREYFIKELNKLSISLPSLLQDLPPGEVEYIQDKITEFINDNIPEVKEPEPTILEMEEE